MAFSVRVPKEIDNYQAKIIGGLTARKLVSIMCAVVLGGGTFALAKFVFGLSTDVSGIFLFIMVIPPFAFGFLQRDGLPFEKLLPLYMRHFFGNRIVKYENVTLCHTLSKKEMKIQREKNKKSICEGYTRLPEREKAHAVAKAERASNRARNAAERIRKQQEKAAQANNGAKHD